MKIGDIVKSEHREYENYLPIAELVGKDIALTGFIRRSNQDGEYLVVMAKLGDSTVTFSTGAKVVMSKINQICEHFGIGLDLAEAEFSEPVEAVIVQHMSREGRNYYDLANPNR